MKKYKTSDRIRVLMVEKTGNKWTYLINQYLFKKNWESNLERVHYLNTLTVYKPQIKKNYRY